MLKCSDKKWVRELKLEPTPLGLSNKKSLCYYPWIRFQVWVLGIKKYAWLYPAQINVNFLIFTLSDCVLDIF